MSDRHFAKWAKEPQYTVRNTTGQRQEGDACRLLRIRHRWRESPCDPVVGRDDSIMKRKWHSPEPINKESREADGMPAVGSTIDQIGTK